MEEKEQHLHKQQQQQPQQQQGQQKQQQQQGQGEEAAVKKVGWQKHKHQQQRVGEHGANKSEARKEEREAEEKDEERTRAEGKEEEEEEDKERFQESCLLKMHLARRCQHAALTLQPAKPGAPAAATPNTGVPSGGASSLLEALAMKRCSSDNHFNEYSSWRDDVAGDRRRDRPTRPLSPNTTLAFHSKQSSEESLESHAEEVLRAMKTNSSGSSHSATTRALGSPGASWDSSQSRLDQPQTQDQQQQCSGGRAAGSETQDSSCSVTAGSSSGTQQLLLGHPMHDRRLPEVLPQASSRGLPICHLNERPNPGNMLARSFSDLQHDEIRGMGQPAARQDQGTVEQKTATAGAPACCPPASSSAAQAAPPVASGLRPGTSRALYTAAASAAHAHASHSPAHRHRATPCLIPRSRTNTPAPSPGLAMTTSAPAPSAALAPTALDSSSSDDCEEATRRITAAFPRLHGTSHERHKSWSAIGGRGSEPEGHRLLRSHQGSEDGSSSLNLSLEEAEVLERRRNGRGNYHLTGPAAAELLLRLNHARQTVDFVKRQAALFSSLNRASMDVWEALEMLNELCDLHAALGTQVESGPAMSLKDHAFQTAELCRLTHPDRDWLHLVGLLHGLGKLLAHRRFGSQPDWAILGESFPLGCRFDPSLQGAQFFSVNPDRRRRMYNSALGIYPPACGLRNVYMSWSAAEYLYLMLLLNDTRLPPEALFIIRYQRFSALTSGTGAYRQLLNQQDEAQLPLLASFQQLSVHRRVTLPPDKTRSREEQQQYYTRLVNKYFGEGRKLSW